MRCVLDCSVALKWFVPEALSDVAELVLERYEAGELTLLAPSTIVAEFGHSLRKDVIGRSLERDRAIASLAQFLDMRIERVPPEGLAADALRLALDHSATFYDGLYLALALREDSAVLTADERMAKAFGKLNRTILLADFK